MDAWIDELIEIENARPTPEKTDKLAEWRKRHNWQDTDDEEEEEKSESSPVDGVNKPSNEDGQRGKSL